MILRQKRSEKPYEMTWTDKTGAMKATKSSMVSQISKCLITDLRIVATHELSCTIWASIRHLSEREQYATTSEGLMEESFDTKYGSWSKDIEAICSRECTSMRLANGEKPTQGNQYIYTAYHFNKEVVKLQIVTTASIDTTENTADLQTKAVGTDKMSKLAGKLKGYEPDWYPTVRHDGSRTTSQSAQGTSKGLAAHSVQCSTNASTLC